MSLKKKVEYILNGMGKDADTSWHLNENERSKLLDAEGKLPLRTNCLSFTRKKSAPCKHLRRRQRLEPSLTFLIFELLNLVGKAFS